jgi:5-methyltetrahydrofolate--homocysteine methyltransferase
MVKALADRLAEAFAEYCTCRRAGTGSSDAEPLEDLHAERSAASGRRWLPGEPGPQPRSGLFDLLDAGQLGMGLTESFAMTPAASVSGLVFAHPSSRYFTVGRIGRDQAADYAARRGIEVAEVERWLSRTCPGEAG